MRALKKLEPKERITYTEEATMWTRSEGGQLVETVGPRADAPHGGGAGPCL